MISSNANLGKFTIASLPIAVAAIVNGFVDREMASPSPHGYIELLALPQVLLGGLLLVGSLLSTLAARCVKITGRVIQVISSMALVFFYASILELYWAIHE
jgi:hypothetical protein